MIKAKNLNHELHKESKLAQVVVFITMSKIALFWEH